MLVAVTGYGQEEDRRRSREAGFNHHLVKPVAPDELHDLLTAPNGGRRGRHIVVRRRREAEYPADGGIRGARPPSHLPCRLWSGLWQAVTHASAWCSRPCYMVRLDPLYRACGPIRICGNAPRTHPATAAHAGRRRPRPPPATHARHGGPAGGLARLEIAVDAAEKRQEPLGHILFDGPPGLGKTTFAICIPHDLGVGLQIASGAAMTAPKDIIPYLTNAAERSVLFIDEIHRLPKAVEEFLYPAMEDFRIDLTLGEGVNARTINMQLKPFTLIGATTRTGLLSAPLRDRFQMREHLDFYTRRGVGGDCPPQRGEAAGGDCRRRRRPRSPAAAAARRGWPITASAGSATTP